MASRQIKKGSEEATFFSEYLMLRQQFYDGEKDESFWEELTQKAKELTDKYKGSELESYVRSVVMSHLEDVQVRFYGRG